MDHARQSALRERELHDYMAHEVRNPLAAAISACTFVSATVNQKTPMSRRRTDDEEEALLLEYWWEDENCRQSIRDDVTIIETSLEFVNELLRSMLDIHRASNKQLQLHESTVCLRQDIFEPVAAMLYRRDEDFVVSTDCQPSDLAVTADRLRLQQVVLNLARNSAKFVEQGYIRLRADVVDGNVCLYVEDSGPGIPAEKRNNLFSRYQESLDVLSQGTGVGLALCKNLVELMKGDLELDSNFQSGIDGCPGTKIIIRLNTPPVEVDETDESEANAECDDRLHDLEMALEPKENQELKDIQADLSVQYPLPNKLSVLFVDDDRILRKLALRSIKKMMPDWEVAEAASGEAAIQLLDQETFDIIFMDQYMTSAAVGMKGTETTRALRARGVTSKICGLSANDLENAFHSAGADAFVIKPFPCKHDELRIELHRILHFHRGRPLAERTVRSDLGTGSTPRSNFRNPEKAANYNKSLDHERTLDTCELAT
jgi:CheY-like chemotaxis protein